ncbi:MAG: PAS domain S-box protein [Anaerolineae bacterium]|nr:PAS domain S-box protein [Anaerolineae bacterium]MCA9894618.1 PAS domain S-box protein [Anaerolineae bacterium]MCB9460834.1 PAS domain S-box protein [Anaerolineaceae bacterium]
MTAISTTQLILDAVAVPLLVVDAGSIVAANKAFLMLGGCTLEDILEKPLTDVLSTEQSPFPDLTATSPEQPFTVTLKLTQGDLCLCSVGPLPVADVNCGDDTLLLTLLPGTDSAQTLPLERQVLLGELQPLINNVHDIRSMLNRMLDFIALHVVYTSANICMVDKNHYDLAVIRGYPDTLSANIIQTFLSNKIVRQALITQQQPVIVHDTAKADHWQNIPGTEHIASWMAVPIVFRDQVIGIINLDHTDTNHFSVRDTDFVEAIAQASSQRLVTAWLQERAEYELQEREKTQDVLLDTLIKTDALYQVARLLIHTENLEETLLEVLNIIAMSLETDTLFMVTYDPVNAEVQRKVLVGEGDPDTLLEDYQGLLDKIEGYEKRSAADLAAAPLAESGHVVALPDGRQAIAGDIREYGVIVAIRGSNGDDFSIDDVELLVATGSQLAISLENADLVEQLQQKNMRLEYLVDKHIRDLQLERQRLRAILDATGEGIFYIEDFRFEYVNPTLCRMVGYGPSELIGQKLEKIHIETESDAHADPFAGLMSSADPFTDQLEVARIRRKDGTEFSAHITFTLVGGPGAEHIRMVGVVRDVSRQIALQEQRMRFITNAAHELRNPLTSFALRLHMLRKQPERLSHHLETLERVNGYIINLVEDMLDLTRFEKGSLHLALGDVDLNRLVHSVSQKVDLFAKERAIEVDLRLPDQPIAGQIDAERFARMLEKLLTNAISFSKRETTVIFKLEKVLFIGLDYARITVEDTGEPMDEDTLETIFEPFSRPGLGDQVDTGMGMALAHAIVRLHGGSMMATSSQGEPNRIVALIPLHKPAAAAD